MWEEREEREEGGRRGRREGGEGKAEEGIVSVLMARLHTSTSKDLSCVVEEEASLW